MRLRVSWVGIGVVLAIAAGLGVARARTAAAQGGELRGVNGEQGVVPGVKTVPQRQWEYKQAGPCVTVSRGQPMTFEDQLNEAGRRGWELVSVLPRQGGQGQDCYLATFKREMAH